MSSIPLKALVVGTGFGCRIQVPALRAAGFEVAGLVGTSLERTAERAEANGIPGAFIDLEEAIEVTGASAVAIATPPHTHAELTLSAVRRGCHVICEKPFAANSAEAREMLEAAERSGVVHLVGHEFRWNPERAMLGRILAGGGIGKPQLANFTSFIPYLVSPGIDVPPWWFNPDTGGGWLGAAGSHLIDWVRSLLGEFDSVSASLQMLGPNKEGADDTFTFRFRLKSGVEGVLQQTAAAWGDPLDIVRIAGSKGTVWLDERGIRLADTEGTRTVSVSPDLALPPMPPASSDPRQNSAKWQMLTEIELRPYLALCATFLALIQGKQPVSQVAIPTFADGLAQMEVLDAIRASALRGGELVHL